MEEFNALVQTEHALLEKEYPFSRVWGAHDDMVNSGRCKLACANVNKNRYSNIFPFDSHCIALSSKSYINASLINLEGLENRPYIVTIGPMHPKYHGPDTCGEFWRMVYEHRVPVIAGLAKVEKGFSGTASYWPEGVGSVLRYGDLEITLKETKNIVSCTCNRRIIEVKNAATAAPPMRVTQFQFYGWPNYGVPSDVLPYLEYVELVEEAYASATKPSSIEESKEHSSTSDSTRDRSPPLLVHCSGGVGRSGAFVTIHSVLARHFPDSFSERNSNSRSFAEKLKPKLSKSKKRENIAEVTRKLRDVHVVDTVVQLRKQRHPWMVETDEQFSFCYQSLLHALLRSE